MLTVASPLLLALALSGSACAPAPGTPDHRELWEKGRTFSEFLAEASSRKEAWKANYRDGSVPDDVLARATALPGRWRLLVVAEDWCGDSVNTIPYVARLVEAVTSLEMRVIDSRVGRALMESHRTPDGRPATPTVVVLDGSFQEAGCWVERPSSLQSWFLENRPVLDEDELYDRKYAWYEEDRGKETLREIVELLEASALGTPICDTP